MKIERINVYRVDLPLKEGRYAWADGKYVEVFDCTIVEIETDEGVSGYGEVCPLGPFYLPAYGPGARMGIGELAPHLIGADPTKIMRLPFQTRRYTTNSICSIPSWRSFRRARCGFANPTHCLLRR